MTRYLAEEAATGGNKTNIYNSQREIKTAMLSALAELNCQNCPEWRQGTQRHQRHH